MTEQKEFNFSPRDFLECPERVFSELWRQGSVIPWRLGRTQTSWLVLRSGLAREVLGDSELYTRQPERAGLDENTNVERMLPGALRDLSENLFMFDEPKHRRLRSLVESAFAKRNVQGMEHGLKRASDKLVSELDSTGTVDLIPAYTEKLPFLAICELLGLRDDEGAQVKDWLGGFLAASYPREIMASLPGIERMRNFLERKFDEFRATPVPGLIADLLVARDSGEQLTRGEFSSMIFVLFLAGFETTVNLLNGTVVALLDHPDQKRKLLVDWTLLPKAVEELLRVLAPVQIPKTRFAARDTLLGGQIIRRGDQVLVHIGASNYDPSERARSFSMEIERAPNHHLSFGTGIHTCLGLQLARMEARIAIRSLFSKFPDLALAVDRNHIEWRNRLGMRSLKRLPVRLVP